MISVIIPTLNEEKYISKCLQGLKNQTFKDFEVIIVDGKSSDNTIGTIKKNFRGKNHFNYKIVTSDKRGVGHQQNVGAKHAKGDIFVFTHADTVISRNTLEKINELFQKRRNVVGGSIIGKFEPIDYRVKLLNIYSPVAQKVLGITYAYCNFVRRSVFEKMEGFRNCICEDNEFGFRLKKEGKIKILTNCRHFVSSRRFVHRGFYSTIWLWISEYLKIKFGRHTPIELYPVVR